MIGFNFITRSFSSVFGGVKNMFVTFVDKASKFDDKETVSVAKELHALDVKRYKRDRYSTEIIWEYNKTEQTTEDIHV